MRRSSAVMEGVYAKARSEEVAPEMRSVVDKACARLEVEHFARDLDRVVCEEPSELVGAEPGAETRAWCQRFRSAQSLLVPSVVLPIREDFWALMGRRVEALTLSDYQRKEILSWGLSYRSELRRYRNTDPSRLISTRDREAATRPPSGTRPRRK